MKSQKRTKNIAQNFLVLFLTVFLLLGICEIFLRVYNPFEFRVKGDKIVLPAKKKYVINNNKIKKVDKTIIHTKNSLGFRGEEPPHDFEKYLTIITIGGSTTECFYISDGKTWTDILGKKLKNIFKQFWINNAGLDGQTTFGHILLMEDYIVKLKPKVVLFLVGVNDRDGLAAPRYKDKGMLRPKLKFQSIKGVLESFANYSEVFSLALNIYRNFKARKLELHHREINIRALESIELLEEIKNKVKQKINNFNQKPFEERLKKLIQISKANNIEPIFITQPTLYGRAIDDITNVNLAKIKSDVWDPLPADGELVWESLERTNDVIRRVGREEKVLVIDLSRELPKSSKYYYDFYHFSNEGNEKIAEIIYRRLCPFLAQNYNTYLVGTCER